jgi:prepilin-type N-terminal cleavage/methylation domain-containing protein
MPSRSRRSSSATVSCDPSDPVGREALTRSGVGAPAATRKRSERARSPASGTGPAPRARFAAVQGLARMLPTGTGRRGPGRLRARNGFSLLEVVVALTILSFSLGVIFEGIGMALRQRAKADDYIRLAVVEESLLGRLITATPEELDALAEGEENGVRWSLEQTEIPPAPAVAAGQNPQHPLDTLLVDVHIILTAPSGEKRELRTLAEKKKS